jgi:hypothetical protein
MERECWYNSSNQHFLSTNPNPPSFLQQLHVSSASPPPRRAGHGRPTASISLAATQHLGPAADRPPGFAELRPLQPPSTSLLSAPQVHAARIALCAAGACRWGASPGPARVRACMRQEDRAGDEYRCGSGAGVRDGGDADMRP